ncbi:hypothetical protein pEaSNUABM35_00026 [Erwinia phage pEa_SNUABM_35]|uniref:Uncharacterized protein n=1 Tax=Erwinia phage pEa_SNUABM_35 TaxID=2869557 RepID=A0AAE7XQV7_9CAUD|nr:hypothetical protein MPK65_gp026 [Erwinia phage pEa_SNUABM_35]QZE59943.1 hypothetical protein pEaSNUABM35_00026 [Erwinia phage pEa_SNUABM_35]QZE60279.1 hypothetical protein pEaSNUABM36_00026 [Erwinia phage pEa_SNUABM_36]
MAGINELRSRLAAALNLEVKTALTADIEYYVDPDGLPMGLVQHWKPDAPEKIIQVIEQYGLRVERVVKSGLPKPIDADNVEWVYHVWSRHPVYRGLSDENLMRREGPRVAGETLTLAVLTWAVLRAERIKELRACPVQSKSYNFERLQERVYVSSVGG